MNKKEVENYFSLRIKQLGYVGSLGPSEVTELVQEAIRQGTADLWHKSNWTFRRREYELTIASEADQYELPEDCCAVRISREQASLYGAGLTYASKDEFDKRVPSPSSHSGGTPTLYTVYRDYNEKSYIQFFPRPDITPIYLSYLMDTPASVAAVPDVARAALYATIGKYLYPPGRIEYMTAVEDAKREVASLEVNDTPSAEELWRFYDDADGSIKYTRPWI